MTTSRAAGVLAAALAVLAAATAHAGPLAYMPVPDVPQGKVYVFDPVTSLTAGIVNAGIAAAADFYAGLILPDGNSIAFLTAGGGFAVGARDEPASFRPAATGLSLAAPFSVTVPGIVLPQWTGGEPRGQDAFFLLGMRAGTVPSFAGADVLGLAVAPFAFP